MSIPDIVADARVETEAWQDYYIHTYYTPGLSARERLIRTQERWRRQCELGRGAYGTVYLETCVDGQRKLRAVKEMKRTGEVGQEADYMRELEAIYKFSHQKVYSRATQSHSTDEVGKYSHCFVRSHGWFEIGDSIFISMDYYEHGDLQRYLTECIPETQARQIASQVLEGLTFMHTNRFVHRDLKPGVPISP